MQQRWTNVLTTLYCPTVEEQSLNVKRVGDYIGTMKFQSSSLPFLIRASDVGVNTGEVVGVVVGTGPPHNSVKVAV